MAMLFAFGRAVAQPAGTLLAESLGPCLIAPRGHLVSMDRYLRNHSTKCQLADLVAILRRMKPRHKSSAITPFLRLPGHILRMAASRLHSCCQQLTASSVLHLEAKRKMWCAAMVSVVSTRSRQMADGFCWRCKGCRIGTEGLSSKLHLEWTRSAG